ncbi:hypothetical protein SUGI_0803510 [Cryptomeria japonica]|uniref:histone-lysine N-methyltransferase ASHH3 isoform X2 n=1 Tax=Cryptomeria japonica TaxID=3369 RepID=UPI0024149A56|nr:histone-lysine N-methyltransferase ASHH3 isoform X2 [Cryptomeria japonica]XP_057853737.1 histone-lysine N-methyltransferase ASHH3 isoform X2 [Cryptomeria japonica]GLJ39348.1 hypothetical protein SUGI_0803510 [Cryptomeria japonica]
MAKRDGKRTVKTENGKKSLKTQINDGKQQGMKTSRERKKDLDEVSVVCSVCEGLGELKFCDQCKKGFHLSCLGSQEVHGIDPWQCHSCLQNKVCCFDCKEYGPLTGGTVRCSYKNCQNYYHEGCARKWEASRGAYSNITRRGYICPHHFCHSCRRGNNWGAWKLIRCLRCPVAYHIKCLPESADQLENLSGFMLCRSHDRGQDAGQKKSPKNIFMQLSVPETPVDFDLPDSLKKWKPLSYTYIKRNMYLTKRKRVDDDGMQCSCRSSSLGAEKICDKDCLCAMLNFSCSSSCGCGEFCVNKPFQQRTVKNLKLSKTEKCGWGVKAGEDIKAGEFLIEYVGEVIDDKTCEERLWKMKERGETNFYLCEISREMVIDATHKANKSRYINHSCQPNTELQKWQNDGETRIGVFAKTDIMKGEFVTYDYQFIQFGTDQQCYCGAADCRRILGAKPSRQKLSSDAAMKIVAQEVIVPRSSKNSHLCNDYGVKETSNGASTRDLLLISGDHNGKILVPSCIGTRVRVWWPLDKSFYPGRIINYIPATQEHTILYDDGEKETLIMSNEKWELDLTIPSIQTKGLDTNEFVDSFAENISNEEN